METWAILTFKLKTPTRIGREFSFWQAFLNNFLPNLLHDESDNVFSADKEKTKYLIFRLWSDKRNFLNKRLKMAQIRVQR